ncbi:hypothetical protein Smp_113680 [Schistosoma mansoni]|uniref:hypothetical protein n=1 Tax=Schistosoma mansoni TaxID=6183 RepID=UPI0001A63CB3|nr:hypothetical protein Smp_113680 [Schistosoma mansoni]|eukprot:XP_018645608.1 hypothetical protein Smp_113680 [Schistosoma mansoni]
MTVSDKLNALEDWADVTDKLTEMYPHKSCVNMVQAGKRIDTDISDLASLQQQLVDLDNKFSTLQASASNIEIGCKRSLFRKKIVNQKQLEKYIGRTRAIGLKQKDA